MYVHEDVRVQLISLLYCSLSVELFEGDFTVGLIIELFLISEGRSSTERKVCCCCFSLVDKLYEKKNKKGKIFTIITDRTFGDLTTECIEFRTIMSLTVTFIR